MSNRTDDTDGAPLGGVLVADFSRVLAGPLATMVLADLGADVVKVEQPGVGDDTRAWGPPWRGDESTYYLSVNRNKRSVTLDLKDPGDRVLAQRLALRADVLVENFRPGAAKRLGIGYDDLVGDNPGLVYATVTGFGQDGEAAGLGGYDFLVQAMSGLMGITGEPGGLPHKVGVALVDVMCGLYTAIGIQSALLEREHSGRGQRVHVSLMATALAALVNQATAFLEAGVVPERLGNQHPSIAPYETLETADRPVALAVGSDRLFARLCDVLGVPELARDARFTSNADRVEHRHELVGELERVLVGMPATHWVSQLRAQGVPVGLVNDVAEAFDEAERLGLAPVLETVRGGDGGVVRTVRSPLELSRTPLTRDSAPPRLGEHDADVRRWLQEE